MPGFNIGGSGTGPNNIKEVSRKHRYLVRLFNPLSNDLLFFARKVVLPAVEIDRITMHHKQEEIYLPGKHRFQQCEINFYRVHDNNGDWAAREIYNWWSNNLLRLSESRLLGGGTPAGVLKRNGEIHILDGHGNTAYKHLIFGVWPNKVSPDTLDFADNSIAEISVNFTVDKVKEESGISVTDPNLVPCGPAPGAAMALGSIVSGSSLSNNSGGSNVSLATSS